MGLTRLQRHAVPKVWGRTDLPAMFADVPSGGEAVGEIWFSDDADAEELLVKYLFTSERLSIQVHPDDKAARAAGYARGKDEAWLILEAEPDATIGIGLHEPLGADALRTSLLDGSIEQKLDWKPVEAGEIHYSTAGNIHAIGAGLALIEVQQNVDLTYRLYDYGRPRELHLEEGLAVAVAEPVHSRRHPKPIAPGRALLIEGPKFVIELWQGVEAVIGEDGEAPVWLIPVTDGTRVDGTPLAAGQVYLNRGRANLVVGPQADLLVAYAGGQIRFQ